MTSLSCTGLTSFTMPAQMTSVPESIFSECTNLEQVTLSTNTITIEGMAFSGCVNLEEIIGSEQVISIGFSAFKRCSSLEHFDFSENSVLIMDNAFAESGLTSVELSNGNICWNSATDKVRRIRLFLHYRFRNGMRNGTRWISVAKTKSCIEATRSRSSRMLTARRCILFEFRNWWMNPGTASAIYRRQ